MQRQAMLWAKTIRAWEACHVMWHEHAWHMQGGRSASSVLLALPASKLQLTIAWPDVHTFHLSKYAWPDQSIGNRVHCEAC